jgi:ABC-type amino acid transport substrate-binding protein
MILAAFSLFWGLPPKPAAADMVYIYRPPGTNRGPQYYFRWEVLRAALERTIPAYGPFELRPGLAMSNNRYAFGSSAGDDSGTNVAALGASNLREKQLIPVRIPIDKGLIGYRVMAVRKAIGARFRAIRSFDDLKRLSFGQEFDWQDAEILRANGLKVVEGNNLLGLYRMLQTGRFDVLPRGASEIAEELEDWPDQFGDIGVESSFVLYYPQPVYFWFAKTVQGEQLAKRAEEGLRAMIEDGSYDRMFWARYQSIIDKLDLKHRRLFVLKNPFLADATPGTDPKLWLTPAQLGMTR